ncbi:MAG: sodium:solute symporter [Muribaculaceae bacterium]|nr:sodium:solute symporter [Muribaculaceae bacterium]MDE6332791.1 sodium:solute symporter [Muribaculaceae bacterium]
MSLPVTIILTIAGYFGLLMAVSAIASRGSDNSTFFTGNRRVPWFVVAFAMMGASISGVTFISVPGMVAEKGYSYLQMVLGFIVGYLLIAFVLVPMFYRRNMISIYGYLEERFGRSSYRSGAWFFFVSKMLGAAVRFFVVCSVLQLLVFGPLGIPFVVNVVATIALIWLYTVQGGVKTLIWTDTLKSFCLIGSVVLCIFFIASDLGYDFWGMTRAIFGHESSRMFYFDNPKASTYFWKQFVGGIFMAIATTGLDQDMMQRNLACKDSRQSQKNMVVSGITQFFVIALFLLLGTLLLIYLENHSIALPEKSDDIFGMVATSEAMPVWVGILFVLGLIAAAYSAAGSALTSLTTSFTVDILGAHRQADQRRLTRTRRLVHLGMSAVMGAVIVVFYYLSDQDAISAVYTLASYTYGPILGLFVFGMFTRREVRDPLVPVVCVLAPVLSWCTQWALVRLWAYHTGFELLLINALYTVAGLWITSPGKTDICRKN